MRLALTLVTVLALTAPSAFGATQRDHDDCNAGDADRNIAGCTRIVEDAAESVRTRAIAFVGRGLAWTSKGDRERAIADFTSAIALDPDDSLAYSNRGLVRGDTGDIDGAIADFTEAIRINPLPRSDLAGVPRVSVYVNRGLAWQAKGDIARALADFDQAIELDGNDADAHVRRAELRVSMSDLDAAAADLGTAISLNPDHARAYFVRGLVRYQQYQRASAWIRAEDLKGAIADLSAAIRLDPENAMAHYARGMAWSTEGDRERAVADLLEAARLAPLDPAIIAALKHFKPDYESAADSIGKLFRRTPPAAAK